MEPIRWSGILDALGDAVIAADRTGTIIYANSTVERVLGWRSAELVGEPLVVLMPERMRPQHEAGFRRYLATGEARLIGRAVRVPALRRDGVELDIELTLTAQSSEHGEIFVAALRDLRDRVELERQLAVTKHMAAATRAAARLTERLDLEHVLSVAVTTLATDFDAALARVWLHDATTNTLVLRASAGLSDVVRGSSRERIDLATYPFKVGVVGRTLQPFYRNQLQGDPEFEQDWVEREGMRSVAVLPLMCASSLQGVFASFFRRPLEGDLFEVLGTFAALVASAIENTRLYMQAQDAVKARDEFLSMASHELRTPLTSLILNLESMRKHAERAKDQVPAATVTDRVRSAARAASHLERLVTRMLDVSTAHGRRLVLSPEPFDLVVLLREIVERHRAEIDSLGCKLDLRSPEALVGTWDRLRLDHVITNLLLNAVKYGRSKPVEVALLDSGDEVVLTVADRGIGIAKDDQARIFDRFERAASADKYGGFGLGLWITKEFVVAMGGSVSVASAPGEGSSFTVVLPRHGPPEAKRGVV